MNYEKLTKKELIDELMAVKKQLSKTSKTGRTLSRGDGKEKRRVKPEKSGSPSSPTGHASERRYRIKGEDGSIRHIYEVVKDVHDRKGNPLYTEGALYEIMNGAGLTGTADTTEQTEIICRFRPDGSLTYVNEAYCRYFGCERQDLKGRNILHTISEQDRQKVLSQLRDLNPERPVGTMECRVMNSFGEQLWNQWSYRAIFDGEGHILEYHSVGRDITYRKYTQDVLEKRAAILEAMTTAAEGFLKSGSWADKIEPVLEGFGKATGASHVFLFENDVNRDAGVSVRRRFEWFSASISSLKGHRQFLKTRDLASRFSQWVFAKCEGKPIYGSIGQFPDREVESLSLEPTLSIAVVPIIVGGRWWGFVGFADYLNEIVWADDEIGPLEAAAGILGAAIERDEKEQKIREQERFLSGVFDSIQDGLGVLDRDLTIVRANPVMEKWPVASRPLVGRKCYESIYGRKKPCRDCPALKTLKTGEGVREIRPSEGPDGTWWMEIFTYPLRDAPNGPITGVIEYVRNITERVNAEEARKLTEERLHTFYNSTQDIVFLKDEQFRFSFVNGAMCDLLGRKEEEIVGRLDAELYPEGMADGLRNADLQALNSGTGVPTVSGSKWGDRILEGVKFPVNLGDGRTGIGGIFRDVTERWRAEEELANTKILLEQAFEQSPYPMALVSMPDMIIRIANPAIREFLEITDEPSPVGQSLFEMKMSWKDCDLQGNPYPLEELPLPRALRGQKTLNQEVMAVTKNGTVRLEVVSGVPIYNARGEILAGCLVCTDITERKRAEEKLKMSEERLRTFIDSTKDIVFLKDDNLRFLVANKACQDLFRFCEEDILGKTDFDFVPRELALRWNRTDLEALATESGIIEAEDTFNGRIFRATKFRIDLGNGRAGLATVVRDVTEQRTAEDALRSSELRYRELADNMPAGIYEATFDGNVIYANRTALDMFGYSADEVVKGVKFHEVIAPDERETLIRHVQSVRQEGRIIDQEYTMLRRDGSRFIGLNRARPMLKDGRVVGSTGIVTDISDLKEAQEALRKNEALLQSILQAAPIGIGIVHDRVIGWVNDHFTRMTGYAGADVIGQSARILYPDDGEYERVAREKCGEIQKGKTGAVETRWRRKDGAVFDIYLSSDAIDRGDLSAGVVFTAYDVTDQKKAADILRYAKEELEKQVIERTRDLDITNMLLRIELEEHRKTEEALVKNEQLYRAIVEDQTELICRFHPDGAISFVNEAFCRYFGKSREEVLGTRYRPPIPREDRIAMTKAVKALTPDNHVTHFEISVELPGQDLRWHLWTTRAIYDEVGRLIEHQAVGRDVTERVRSQHQIRDSRNMLRSVFDGISDPLVMVGGDLTVLMLNRATLEFFDVGHYRELIGLPCLGHLIERYGRDHAERVKEAIGESAPSRFDLTANVKAIRYEEVSVYPVRGVDDVKGLAIIRVTDRTKQVIMERELIQNEKLASLGLLISGIVHEINNPNNFIVFNIPILRDYLKEILPIVDAHAEKDAMYEVLGMTYSDFRTDVMKLLDNIEHGSHRINVTVAKLKEFSRKREEKGLRAVATAEVIQKALSICHTQIRKTVKTFDVEIDPGLLTMTTDPEAIEQVLINLLINAAQAADKDDSLIRLHVFKGDSWKNRLIMEVIDNGCGMDATTASRIFDPFFTTKAEGCGTGLGLYISKNLIESAGGSISLESEPGRGTTFRVIFPDLESREPKKMNTKDKGVKS